MNFRNPFSRSLVPGINQMSAFDPGQINVSWVMLDEARRDSEVNAVMPYYGK